MFVYVVFKRFVTSLSNDVGSYCMQGCLSDHWILEAFFFMYSCNDKKYLGLALLIPLCIDESKILYC